MITFKSTTDLQTLPANDPAHSVIKELIDQLIRAYTWEGHPYVAEDYGYIILIEPEDSDRVLSEIWDDWTLLDIPWEGITREGDFFIAVFLANNQFGLVFVIPDVPWVNDELREVMEEQLDPAMATRDRKSVV